MTVPSVIVATAQEQTVRLYVGAPSNGGMNQVAQLTTAHAIDPHDLADMAMSLSVQFGWLAVESNGGVAAAPAKLEAPALPPVANATSPRPKYPSDKRMEQRVPCPAKGCDHIAKRKNLAQHLLSSKHRWTRDNANRASRLAQPVDAPAEPVPAPAPAPSKPKRASVKSKGVSGLGIPANMRYGTVGRRELERVGYPKILEWMSHAEQVNSQQLAKHFGESTSAAKHWLNALQKRGDVVRTNPDAGANETHWYAVAPTLAQPVTSSVGFGHEHEHEAHITNTTQTQAESESTSV